MLALPLWMCVMRALCYLQDALKRFHISHNVSSGQARYLQSASPFWRCISTPRQEHQVGRFLGIPEKRLARRANSRTHGKATSKINELACADVHRKVRRDF